MDAFRDLQVIGPGDVISDVRLRAVSFRWSERCRSNRDGRTTNGNRAGIGARQEYQIRRRIRRQILDTRPLGAREP